MGATFVPLDELLSRSDFVLVACPLNDETRHMFGKAAFGKMKRTSVFVNVARGGESDLCITQFGVHSLQGALCPCSVQVLCSKMT